MKFGTFHGVEDSGLLGCDAVLKVVPSISTDCGTVILTLEDGGTMIRNSLPNGILCYPRRLQSVATTQISLSLDCCPRNVCWFYHFSLWCAIFEGGTGQDRKRRVAVACVDPLCWWSVYMTVIYLLSLLECSSCDLLWQLSFCQCFIPSCCQAHLKDCALIQCIVCYRQLITLVWTAMWCSVSSICLTMLSLGMIRWGMHSVRVVNTCYTCSFIVLQHSILGDMVSIMTVCWN